MTVRDLPRIWREFGAVALRAGWVIERTQRGHFQWKSPNHGPIVTTAKTPSDHRSIHNVRAQLRRAGLKL